MTAKEWIKTNQRKFEILSTKMEDFILSIRWRAAKENGGCPMMTSVVLLLYCIAVATTTGNDVTSGEGESLVERLREENLRRPGGSGSPIAWGLVDTTAVVGRLFEYHLPKPSFNQYQVTEAGTDRLPRWLNFDPTQNVLEGVPGPTEPGRLCYIEVTASNHLTTSKDIFVVHLKADDAVDRSDGAKPLRDLHGNASYAITCRSGSAVTMATVIMDADFDAMPGSVRAKILREFARILDLSVDSLRMREVGVAGQQLDNSALVAGPGNVLKPRNGNGVLVQWVVGCGSVQGRHMKILQNLELAARDGTLANATGSGVTGWHVTNSKKAESLRRRRVVHHQTSTLQPTMRPPHGQPTATRVVLSTDGPETRFVPSFASPVPSGASEKPHRTKTKGRHHSSKTKVQKIISTRLPDDWIGKQPPDSSATFFPTPVLPVVPTESDYRQRTTTVISPIPPDVLEPSLVFPGASLATTPTRKLSTSSHSTTPFASALTPPRGRTPPLSTGEGLTSPALPTAVEPPPSEDFNFPPLLKTDIEQLTVSVGEVFKFTIPNETFFDYEDGSTRNLKLLFLTVDGLSMTPTSWIKFNDTTQILYGMPLEEHAGKQEYVLAAIDSGGKQARDSFETVIQRRFLERKVNHEVTVCLDEDFNMFMMNVDLRVDVARRIAHAHGDPDVINMAVTRIQDGSVRFSWTNLSLAHQEPCPSEALLHLIDNMIQRDGTLNPDLVDALYPHQILYVEYQPRGNCTKATPHRSGGRPEDIVSTTVGFVAGESSDPDANPKILRSLDGVIMTMIIPILIIVVILALAFVLVCAVCSRRKKGEACDPGLATTTRKGVPVIFADELEEKPTQPTKPLILTDEKPPVAPPDYDQATASNSPSTPRSCCNDPLIPGAENGTSVQRPVHPGDQSTYKAHSCGGAKRKGGRGVGQRQPQQVSRKPPPYVSS